MSNLRQQSVRRNRKENQDRTSENTLSRGNWSWFPDCQYHRLSLGPFWGNYSATVHPSDSDCELQWSPSQTDYVNELSVRKSLVLQGYEAQLVSSFLQRKSFYLTALRGTTITPVSDGTFMFSDGSSGTLPLGQSLALGALLAYGTEVCEWEVGRAIEVEGRFTVSTSECRWFFFNLYVHTIPGVCMLINASVKFLEDEEDDDSGRMQEAGGIDWWDSLSSTST